MQNMSQYSTLSDDKVAEKEKCTLHNQFPANSSPLEYPLHMKSPIIKCTVYSGLVEEACMESPQFHNTRDSVGARVRFNRTKWMFPFFSHMFPLRLRVHFVG